MKIEEMDKKRVAKILRGRKTYSFDVIVTCSFCSEKKEIKYGSKDDGNRYSICKECNEKLQARARGELGE